jgi:uncharacterized membrane protein
MIDDPISSALIATFFAVFFGFQVFDLIEKKAALKAIVALVLFGLSFAFVLIDTKEIMYGPDLRGTELGEPNQ